MFAESLHEPDQNAIAPQPPRLRWPGLSCRELIRLLPVIAGDYRISGPPVEAIRAQIRLREFILDTDEEGRR